MKLSDLIEALETYYDALGNREIVSVLIIGGKIEVVSTDDRKRSGYVN